MIEWIVSSCILIAIIIALRYILKGKISPRLQYSLWALVLLRLLLPVSFGSTDLSVTNAIPDNIPESLLSAGISRDARLLPEEAAGETASPAAPRQPVEKIAVSDGANWSGIGNAAGQMVNWGKIVKTVWLSGIAVVGLWFLVSNMRLASRLKKSRRTLDAKNCTLPVFITDEIETPCLFGIFHPAIYVTAEGTESKTKLFHVIEHELTHYRHGDHIWSILRGVCLALHWYNPLVWWAAALSRRDAELACDEATIGRIGESERAEYGRTLIGMTCQKQGTLLIAATTMTTSGRGIRERITLLAKKPKTALCTLISIALIAVVAISCTFTGPRDKTASADIDLTLFETGGLIAAIPNEYLNQLIVLVGEELNDQNALISVYEKASAEAAAEDGHADSGLGWLFSLIRYDRVQYERYLCADGSGLSFFAKDGDWYYGYATATDVRFYPRGDDYMAEQALWATLNNQVGRSVRDDFIIRNNLTPHSDDALRNEYTYDGAHRFLNYYPYYSVNGSKDEIFVLVLSQPVTQGEGGIWCVERMMDSYGHVYLWFPDSGMAAAEYYAELQAECDAGQTSELLAPEGAAVAFLNESGYFGSAVVSGSLEETTAPKGLAGAGNEAEALTDIFTSLISEKTPVRLALTIVTADQNMVIGDHNGWGCGNDVQLSRSLSDFTYEVAPPGKLPAEGRKITLISARAQDDWSVDFYEGSNYLRLNAGGQSTCYVATYTPENEGYPPVGSIMRLWFDEAQWLEIGGSYKAQGQIIIPNTGQNYLIAAKEYCEAFEGKHLIATSGSRFCYTYVSCSVESAEDTTAHFRERGEIGENTYAFYLTTVFVPENEQALSYSMAGNTGEYTGNDPDVPEGAFEYYRCGYITLEQDGWHGELVGTGW